MARNIKNILSGEKRLPEFSTVTLYRTRKHTDHKQHYSKRWTVSLLCF